MIGIYDWKSSVISGWQHNEALLFKIVDILSWFEITNMYFLWGGAQRALVPLPP